MSRAENIEVGGTESQHLEELVGLLPASEGLEPWTSPWTRKEI
jgi:hypothetical protein